MRERLTLPQLLQVAVATLAALILVLPFQSVTSTAHSSFSESISTDQEITFVRMLNAERVQRGLPELFLTNSMTEVAREHTRAMAASDVLFHSSALDTRLCCHHGLVAETVGYGESVSSIHGELMRSPEHREILLHPQLQEFGVGASQVGERVWVTYVFRTRE